MPASKTGGLIIEARREQMKDRDYTAARLQSRQEWTYGRFEISAKLPSDGRGIVSALWMLGNPRTYGDWPASGEIDIMEHVGHWPDVIHGTIHTETYNHRIGTHKKETTMLPTARTHFNLYAVGMDTLRNQDLRERYALLHIRKRAALRSSRRLPTVALRQ